MGRIFGRHFSGEIAFREADPLTVAGCLHQRGDLGQGGEGQQQADGSQDTAVDDAHRWTDEASNDEENTCYQCNVEGFHFFLLLNWDVPFFWLDPKEPKVQGCTGWATSLYTHHYVVYRNGTIHIGRTLEEVGAHCQGHNQSSIGICYIGGLSADGRPKDTRTPEQKAALRALVTQLKERFPGAQVYGHNRFAAKACPCFRVPEEL